jgi:SAM-dependent methyltransferase
MTSDESATVDFGRAAQDYARYRHGFPAEFFDHVRSLGVGVAGQDLLDLGTGTGAIACEFARRGCLTTGLDVSPAMLAEAAKAAADTSLPVRWVCAPAETTGLADGAFDAICAGMCWHWFERPRAAAEVFRLLRPGGRMVIVYFAYIARGDTVGAATEQLVLRHNPGWVWAGGDGRHHHYVADLVAAGLQHVSTFDVVLPVSFTHEGWRGRFRACNGVLTQPPETVAAFDAELGRLLVERYPEPVVSDHRLFGIVVEKPLVP